MLIRKHNGFLVSLCGGISFAQFSYIINRTTEKKEPAAF